MIEQVTLCNSLSRDGVCEDGYPHFYSTLNFLLKNHTLFIFSAVGSGRFPDIKKDVFERTILLGDMCEVSSSFKPIFFME